MNTTTRIHSNDRIVLRDRPWIVRQVTATGEDHYILEIEALDGDRPSRLSVAVPPDEPEPLPGEDLSFDLGQLESFSAWSHAHRILGATLICETGLLSGARFGRVALEAYQLAPTLRLLSKPRPSLLIADDVGLGKTIEAGLAMLELLARGRASRILVVAPPGLLDQWRDELLDKFALQFRIIGNASNLAQTQTELPAGVSPWDALPRVITSIDYIKKEAIRRRALRKPWDLVVVDEAHALAESGTPQNPYRTQRTRLGTALREASRGLLLLTATPHNGYAHSFRSLIELVEPSLASLHGSVADVERRIETARIRRMKSQIQRRLPGGGREQVFPQRKVQGLPVHLSDEREKELLRKVATYCSKTARQAEGTEEAELVGFAMQIVKKRALSSRAALMKTLEHRLEALKKEEGREEKPSRAEIRDYQAELPLTEGQSERTARRILRSAIPADEKRRKAEARALNGIRRLLKKLPDRDPKIEALISELKRVFNEEPTEKVIVFTEYRDTLEAIRKRFDAEQDLAGGYVILRGGLTRRQRLARQEQFAQAQVRVLLATDAASEGLNLQHHCRRIVHVELPWNPNRLEQRNGRVDRYGQSREPIIRFLYYPDSPEDDVLARLIEKIEQMAKDRVSTPDILGVLSGRGKIDQDLVRLDPEARDVEQRKRGLVHLFEDRTAEFVREVKPLLAGAQDSEQEMRRIMDLLDTKEALLPDDEELENIVLALLDGSMIPHDEYPGVYRIEVPWPYRSEGVPAVYPAVTFRRSVAVRYRGDQVEYVTPLHPLARALALDARRRLLQVYPNVRGLPPRRLAARAVPPGEPASAVFTWLGEIRGGGGLLEERLLAVRVAVDGRVVGTSQENLCWLQNGAAGNVPRTALERIFRDRFDELRARARAEAERWLKRRADELRALRRSQADLLRKELDRDVADRLKEIDEEQSEARGLVEDTGQMRLFAGRDKGRGGFEARRRVVQAYQEQRREEISAFEEVLDPFPPRPLGALFLVPEGDAR